MRALVTGAGGFVGHHLLAHLEACGDEVFATDRATDGLDVLDAPALQDAMRRIRPEVIYHLAGASDVGGSWDTPQTTFRANAEGTLNVLWAARETGVQRVMTVGSADVYGRVTPQDLPLVEDHPLAPVSPYAASKVAADYVALQAWLGFGQDVIRARPFNHLGPGQSTRFVAPALASRIVANERSGGHEVRVGNLTPRRDFTDVRDVVRAYRLLVTSGTSGTVYNVCSGVAPAISELAAMMIECANHEMELITDPDLERAVDIPVLLGDPTRIRTDTGWMPEIPLRETISDLIEDQRRMQELDARSRQG